MCASHGFLTLLLSLAGPVCNWHSPAGPRTVDGLVTNAFAAAALQQSPAKKCDRHDAQLPIKRAAQASCCLSPQLPAPLVQQLAPRCASCGHSHEWCAPAACQLRTRCSWLHAPLRAGAAVRLLDGLLPACNLPPAGARTALDELGDKGEFKRTPAGFRNQIEPGGRCACDGVG